jgi:hypothetical protein
MVNNPSQRRRLHTELSAKVNAMLPAAAFQ